MSCLHGLSGWKLIMGTKGSLAKLNSRMKECNMKSEKNCPADLNIG
jgi:hypothetical protein